MLTLPLGEFESQGSKMSETVIVNKLKSQLRCADSPESLSRETFAARPATQKKHVSPSYQIRQREALNEIIHQLMKEQKLKDM